MSFPSNSRHYQSIETSQPRSGSAPLSQLSKTRLTRRRLRATLQVRVRIANRPSDCIEGKARRLGRELHLSANVEESEIAVDQVVGDACCFVLTAGKYHISRLSKRMTAALRQIANFSCTNQSERDTHENVNLTTQYIFGLFESVVS